jgi:serine/threonine-protein kinase
VNLLDVVAEHLPHGYAIERTLGVGGTSTVYLATRAGDDNARLVVKVLHGRALRPGHADRFRREIEILQKLEHARIVPILAAGEADGVCFFTMPFVDGETLRARLHADGPLSARDTLLIARDIADALGHAHGRGVVHRDVKPENVLISADGAQLMDFGFASAPSLMSHDALDGEAALVIGTPHYISPEQVRGRQASDWRGDFFSLGCVMHEMLTGRPPWVAASARELMRLRLADAAPDVRRLRADVPADVAAILRCNLAPYPNDRYATAAFLRMAIDSALARMDEAE